MYEELAREIERVRRRHLSLVEGAPAAPATWEIVEEALCWHVVLRDALEPDIDVEVMEDALVVRADVHGVLETLLPVPAPYEAARPVCRFRAGLLEVRVSRRRA